MSYEERVDMITMVAGFDASETINRFVVTGADGKAELSAAGVAAIGVLTSNAPEDHAVRVVVRGIVPVEVGVGGLNAGDTVASGADGVAVAGVGLGVVQASPDGSVVAFAEGAIAPIFFHPTGAVGV